MRVYVKESFIAYLKLSLQQVTTVKVHPSTKPSNPPDSGNVNAAFLSDPNVVLSKTPSMAMSASLSTNVFSVSDQIV